MKRENIPEAELAAHDAHTLKGALRQVRTLARQRCEQHALSLLREEFGPRVVPEVLDIATVVADMMQVVARSAKTTRAVAIHDYLRSKVSEVDSMTASEAASYDPEADRGWP